MRESRSLGSKVVGVICSPLLGIGFALPFWALAMLSSERWNMTTLYEGCLVLLVAGGGFGLLLGIILSTD